MVPGVVDDARPTARAPARLGGAPSRVDARTMGLLHLHENHGARGRASTCGGPGRRARRAVAPGGAPGRSAAAAIPGAGTPGWADEFRSLPKAAADEASPGDGRRGAEPLGAVPRAPAP